MHVLKNPVSRCLLIVLLIALGIRVFGLGLLLEGDEYAYFFPSVENRGPFLMPGDASAPPLVPWIDTITSFIAGLTPTVLRISRIMVGLLVILLTYACGSMIHSRRAGLFAAALMAISSYHIYASVQIDNDASFLVLFYVLTAYAFLKYRLTSNRRWLVIAGMAFGCSVLTKLTGALILPALVLYDVIHQRSIKKALPPAFVIGVIGIVVFSIFPLLSWWGETHAFEDTLQHTKDKTLWTVYEKLLDPANLPLLLIQVLLTTIWLSPVLVGFGIEGLMRWRKYLFECSWIVIVLFAYFILNVEPTKPIDKYLAILIPPLAMIGGALLDELKPRKNHLAFGAVVFVVFSIVFFVLNNLPGDLIDFYPKQAFLDRLSSFSWDFLLPITGSSGPIGFFLNAQFIIISFIISMLVFAARFFVRPGMRHWLLIAFLAVGLANNLVLTSEHLFSVSHPSINAVTKDAIAYVNAEKFPDPLYVFRNRGITYYTHEKYGGSYRDITILDFHLLTEQMTRQIDAQHPTVLFIDFPRVPEDNVVWKHLRTSCTLMKSFADKGVTLGSVYRCAGKESA